MRILFLLANVTLVLFLAAPNRIEAQEPKEGQIPSTVARLEERIAELEKRLALVESQLTKIAGTTSGAARAPKGPSRSPRDDGARFTGNWKGVRSGTYMYIERDGDKYIIGEPSHAGGVPCELVNGKLKCNSVMGNVEFIESSGHIIWRGVEWERLP